MTVALKIRQTIIDDPFIQKLKARPNFLFEHLI